MKGERVIRLLGIGADLAVVAGLIFVGLEVRNSRASAQAQIADGIAEGFLEVNAVTSSDPSAACIWSVGWAAPDRLTDLQAARFAMYVRMDLNQYMRVQALHNTGLLSDDEWRGPAETAAWKLATPGGRLFLSENLLPQSFLDAIGQYRAEASAQGFMLGRPLPDSCP